ncbi:PKD domain-containing protein, partial [Actinotalea sp. M2MS4P-6]|uniref:PKD domain-containing protein n=1 Tax=Actinotalea sp. M2MS4P-6 TaxID=2983762 RepID=UPI0021E40BD7
MSRPAPRRLWAAVAVMSLAIVGVGAPAAYADTAPASATEPLTVSSDPLPTVQINGVAWVQLIVGNTVYVGGEFTSARPAGSPLGTNEVPRSNLLAYNLQTGVLISSFNHVVNAQVKDLAVSPDGSTLYIGGSFTQVDGQNRYRAAAIDVATGALTSFRPVVNATVTAISATDTTVWLAGSLTNVNGQARQKVAAVNAGTGLVTQSFTATVENGTPLAMVLAPDQASVVIGGSFTSVSGSSDPGYGLARLDSTTGAVLPLPVNTYIQDAGTASAVLSLESDGEHFYGSGYHFGGGGNMEGSFSADWATGSLTWVEDCHGDTYSVFPAGDAVYSASHKHYCGNSGGFPQTTPWTYHRATATTKTAERINTADPYGYPDHDGEPSPQFLNWYPDINVGTYTGKSQGPWTVSGNDQYVLYGGEFTMVNSTAQQGLVRFAMPSTAPNLDGPRSSGANFSISATSFATGTARVSWSANWDRDNETLSYALYRNSTASDPIYTTTLTTPFWDLPRMGFTDTGLTPGSTARYRVIATDPWGNFAMTDWVTVTVADSGDLSAYASDVLNDGASTYWRLGEPSGDVAFDWAGFDDATVGTGVTRGVASAIGDSDQASSFDGTSNGTVISQNLIQGPDTFTLEAWFRTTTTAGGKIVGFGNASSGGSSSYDRHVYMNTAGQVVFGVWIGSQATVASSQAYNDGEWHHVVASLGSNGERLYVDGQQVGSRATPTAGQAYQGYWRVGGDTGWDGTSYFAGDIDDVAIYPTVVDYQTVVDHFTAGGGTVELPPVPADAYGAAVQSLLPDLYWRLDETSGTDAADTGWFDNPGVYRSGYTLGTDGALTGVADSAVTFDGVSGLVSSASTFVNPTTYSEELWFRTTSTNGGKLIGFGNNATGTSTNYDRHVYMETDGRLTFGVWTGQTNTITSPLSYNDGQWHHMVATQSSAGMVLYVDGAAVGTNPQTAAQSYTGYWRVGGDTTWGPQPWFAGDIDEVAVYSQALDATTVAEHYELGVGPVNHAPTAMISASTTDLTASLDGSGSTDTDGTVVGWDWDFGDGETGSGETASHTYAAAGTYTVTLTVTDDGGLADSTSVDVTVTDPPPNVAPTAVIGSTVTDLDVALDGSGSTDTDGTVVGWDWDFGDGETGSGETTSHTYAAAGTYTVTLTVTDDVGATDSTTVDVTVTEPLPVNVAPTASFVPTPTDLTVALDGSGSTDTDGTVVGWEWDFGDGETDSGETTSHTYAAAGTYTIVLTVTDDGAATGTASQDVTVTAPNQAPTAVIGSTVTGLGVSFTGSGSTDPDGTVVGWDWDFGDGETASGETASHTYAAAGTYTVTLTVTDDIGATGAVTADVTVAETNQPPVPAFTFVPTDLSVAVDGSGSTDPDGTVTGWDWDFGDGGTASGETTSHAYAASGTYTVTLTVTDDGGAQASLQHDVTVTAPVVNQPPTAAFSFVPTDLTASFDGSASSDSDGTIAGWAWDFGDSQSGSGATVSHAYAAAGTYTVTLTVTDDGGATGSVSHDVTVSEPVGGALAQDGFSRLVLSGWGSAPVGGAWSVSGPSGGLSVDGSAGVQVLGAGQTGSAWLGGVSSDSTEVQVSFSADKVPSGGGAFVYVAARRVSATNYYGSRVRLRADGTVELYLTAGNGTPVSGVVVSGLTFAAGDQLQMRVQAQGTSPTTLRAKVWKVGTTEPTAWQLESTDSTASLQVAGGVGVSTYLFSTAANAPVTFTYDDLWAGPVGSSPGGPVVPPANIAPAAAFGWSTAALVASFDGSASSDSDGTIAGWAWDFGDSQSGSGATVSHAYAAAGTYTVTLTVTDDGGATGSVSHDVTVSEPVGGALAQDGFSRLVLSGWGSAPVGGAWSVSGPSGGLSVDGSAGVQVLGAGQTGSAWLGGVSSDSTEVQVSFSADKVPSGGGAFVYVAARRVSATNYYGSRVRLRADGTVELYLTAGNGTPVSGVVVSGLTFAAGDQLQMRVQAQGTSPTTLRAKVWKVGTTEPTAWQLESTDSTASLQVAGGVGVSTYLFSTAANAPVTFTYDDLWAGP